MQLRSILPSDAACIYIRQPAPLGLGHAVLCAQPVVGSEPFFVHLADDLIDASRPVLAQMSDRLPEDGRQRDRRPAGGAERDGSLRHRGGRRRGGRAFADPAHRRKAEAGGRAIRPCASSAATCSRASIFDRLQNIGRGAGGEIQLTDGIAALLADEPVYAYRFSGKRYDCGSKLGYLEATVEYALRHPELGERFADYLEEFVANRKPKR